MITLRDYQVKTVNEVYSEWRSGKKRVCLQLPTGAGKTSVFSKIVEQVRGKRPDTQVLLVAHRQELIEQMHHRLGDLGISSWCVYAGRPKAPNFPVQCASVQTLAVQKKESDWAPNVGLVIIDECHHAAEGTGYSRILDRYPEAKVLGVTATPCRLDGKGLNASFESLVLGPTTKYLIEQGYLSPYKAYQGSHADLSGVKVRGGDYNIGALAERSQSTKLLGDLVSSWQQLAAGKRTIVFAVNIEHSLSIVARYQAAGIPCEHIDGKTPVAARKAILGRFKTGETLVLSNVGIVTEGFDLPACEAVQLARATKSLSLYLQMVGRALRVAEGKEHAIILDHGQNIETHGLPCDSHVWSLDAVKKRPSRFSVDEESGEITSQGELDIENQLEEDTTAEMVEVKQGWRDRIDEIVLQVQRNGYKPYAAYHRVCERFLGSLTLDHLRYLAKQLGYHWKWADRKYEEFKTAQLQEYGEEF